MRLLLQRVKWAGVTAPGREKAEIGPGLLVLCGFGGGDGPDLPETRIWTALVDKTLDLRIFPDAAGRMNLSLRDAGGEILLVPQFTLYASCRKGRRPSFASAAPPDAAEALFDRLCADVAARLPGRTRCGFFGADMEVELCNRGPVTVLLDGADFVAA